MTPVTGGTSEAPLTDESSGTTAATSETATAGNPCVAPLSGPDADGDRSGPGSVAWERSITSTPPADDSPWGPVRWVREADDARLIAVTHGGRVIALSRESGDESSDGGGIVAAFAIRGGTRRWRRKFDRDASLLDVTNGRAIAAVDAGANGTRAVALDANTGETRWTVESGAGSGRPWSAPIARTSSNRNGTAGRPR